MASSGGILRSGLQTGATRARDALTLESVPDEPISNAPLSFQSEMGRISRQSGIVFAGTIFTAVFGYVFKVYLAHVLGAEALGLYALGMTIISFLGIINGLGLPESAVRFVSLYVASGKLPALRALLWNGSWILLTSNLVIAALVLKAGPWIAVRFYHSPQLVRYLPLFALIMVTGALNVFFGKVLAGYKEVGRRTVITRFVASPLTMVLTIALIILGGGLWGYLVAQIVSAVIVLGLLVTLVWRLTPAAARSFDASKLSIEREVWSFSAAMFGVGMMEFFMSQTDRVALGHYRGAHDVGVYAVAATLVAYEPIILQSVNQIFAPVIADIHTRGDHRLLDRLFQTLTKWMLGLSFPLAVVMILFARPIMAVFGHDFEAGWPILVIGTCGQLVNCGVGSVGCMLLMSGNQHRLVRVQAYMAAIMVVLSIWLVPHWGVWGAAVAAAVTNVGVNVWNLVEVRSALKLSPYNRSYLKLVPPLACAFFVTWLASKLLISVPIFTSMKADLIVIFVTLVSAYATFSAIALLMGLDEDDRLIANAVWAQVRGAVGH
jgi:O-antigen/teichoic acid export membrane protein